MGATVLGPMVGKQLAGAPEVAQEGPCQSTWAGRAAQPQSLRTITTVRQGSGEQWQIREQKLSGVRYMPFSLGSYRGT